MPDETPTTPAPTPTRTPRGGVKTPARGAYPESVTRLSEELAKLPGIGRRSAERLAFHLLKSTRADALALARAINDVKDRVRHCRICYNLADAPSSPTADPANDSPGLCAICADAERDRSLVMVVEQPKDLISLELTGAYKGIYHVLMGRISPLEGVGPGDITLADLLARIETQAHNAGGAAVREVVLALNPTMESDGTALYIMEELKTRAAKKPASGVRVTRLARGVPTGAQLEFAHKGVLADAIEHRRPV